MPKKAKRPLSVTWLVVLVLIFTVSQWLRAASALDAWNFTSSLPLRVSPLYLGLSGVAWGLAGTLIVVGLWRGASWAPRLLQVAAPGFAIYYWLDRLLLQAPGPQQANWPFALFATLGLLAWMHAGLTVSDAPAYFGEINEQSRQD